MKYSILGLSLLLSFAISAMEERGVCKACIAQKEEKKPHVITASVGQIVTLDVYSRDQQSNVFYFSDKKPDDTILQFVKETTERKESAITSGAHTICTQEYLALKPGATTAKYSLYATAFCKFLGAVDYEIVVK